MHVLACKWALRTCVMTRSLFTNQVDVRRLKEALWLRIKQLSERQRESLAEDEPPPADIQLRFQVQHLLQTSIELRALCRRTQPC